MDRVHLNRISIEFREEQKKYFYLVLRKYHLKIYNHNLANRLFFVLVDMFFYINTKFTQFFIFK
jgi:hypothetical protein